MKIKVLKYLYPAMIIISVLILFYPVFLHGLVPIPADTIIGLYHPYRDLYSAEYPNGIPFKNFLITDPVRQIIPWKMLVVESWRSFELPLWNPYEMTGKPLLANFQSGALYPLNILLLSNFVIGWTIFIMIQQIMGSLFFYWYLRNLSLSQAASFFGSLTFVFSGFFIAWLEWGNIGHTALWLPLILLAIDKMVSNGKSIEMKDRKKLVWLGIYLFALICSFFAGHLQTFFYAFSFSSVYFLIRWIQHGRQISQLSTFALVNVFFVILTAVQWIPSLQFILLSARSNDQLYLNTEGWFIPLIHLIQFVAPDFFGNPTTLNYWGTWNYGELVGYIGIVPLLFAIFAFFSIKQKKVQFFTAALFLSLVFAVQNPLSELPYKYSIPFISTAQPTRLLFIAVFSLAVLAGIGFNKYSESKTTKKKNNYSIFLAVGIVAVFLGISWILILTKSVWLGVHTPEDLLVSRKNLILPTALLSLTVCVLIFEKLFLKTRMLYLILAALIILTALDLFRFGNKFLPFTHAKYLFPDTKTTRFLTQQQEPFRIMSLNSEILPPNFSTVYKLSSVEGYDPLYTEWYGRFVTSLEKGEVSNDLIRFKRIILPRKINSDLFSVMNVEYILSTSDAVPEQLSKVTQEGQTRIFKNTQATPRVFFVARVHSFSTDEKQQKALSAYDLTTEAIVGPQIPSGSFASGSARILQYDMNRVEIETTTSGQGFLVFSDAYYPTWSASIDGKEVAIHRTNYAFRGVVVPAGKHTVLFKNALFKL